MTLRVLGVGLLLGFLLNLFGWLGNVFLLGGLWREAVSSVPVSAWRDSPWRDALSLLPDFVYGLAMAWGYVTVARGSGASPGTALKVTLWVFVVGAFTTYLGIANSGLLPWKLSIATTLLALVIFVPAAWLLDRLLRNHVQDPNPARPPGQ